MDELKTFASENSHLQPDEWTEPVIVFNKPSSNNNPPKSQAKAKPKFRPTLNLGVVDDDKMMLPNPHSNFPPP